VLLALPKALRGISAIAAVLAATANAVVCFSLFSKKLYATYAQFGLGIELTFRLYHFSAFILAAAAGFGLLIALYCAASLRDKPYASKFFAYALISLAFVNGAVLADNFLVMLFFWEGLLLTVFTMIALTNTAAFQTAIKALIILGIADLCMMVGIALTANLAGTLTISKIHLPLHGLGIVAFILLMIGAISKAGSMPFHSWIPDAALAGPLPFMALLPAALEKLLGIYFLTRISFDLFALKPESWVSPMLMIIGVVTILLAVMMALVQKDYKRLLSYHAISQVGYMILGIGTCVPAGMVGGVFHMINHAMYKSCLFLTGGSVEKQAGTTDLNALGGLAKKMPLTFACFLVAAASISGVPPFNGFFSKELVYDGALERGWIFYALALLGSFFTAASFLKLGHAVYLGKPDKHREVKEAPLAMLAPMITIALLCVGFGLFNALPIRALIEPVFGHALEGRHFSGIPANAYLIIATVIVLCAALINHIMGAKRFGGGLHAVDHIHHAPVLSALYEKAEKKWFDPYDIGLKCVGVFSRVGFFFDRAIDWFYEGFIAGGAKLCARALNVLHSGNYALYVVWSLVGCFVVLAMLFRSI